jgi:hypothetical protein
MSSYPEFLGSKEVKKSQNEFRQRIFSWNGSIWVSKDLEFDADSKNASLP